MSSRFTLDPVSGIPDPPDDDSMMLEWAKELTKSLQRDHIESVDRAETQSMMDYGTDDRPESTGSRRFHFDSDTGTLSFDAEQTPTFSEWVNINNVPTYQPDGLGVHVILEASLPFTTPGTTGYISWDEEVWDTNSYWAGGSPTEIDFNTEGMYAVRFEATLTGLGSGGSFITEVNGHLSTVPAQIYTITSDGAGETYNVVISYQREFVEDDTLKFYWSISDTCEISECLCMVTPLTSAVGSIGAQPILSDHGELSGLGDDDHSAYLLASDATDRATFATNWTDLTDGGATSLHSHGGTDLYLDNNQAIYWRNAADTDWVSQLKMNGSNDFQIGNIASGYDTQMYGYTIKIDSTTTMELETTNSLTLDVGGQFIVDATGGAWTLDAGAQAVTFTSGFMYLTATEVILPNGIALSGKNPSGAARHLIKKNSSNQIEIGGDPDAASASIFLDTTGDIFLGTYAAQVEMKDSGGTYRTAMAMGTGLTFKIADANVSTIIRGSQVKLDGPVEGDYKSGAGGPTQGNVNISNGEWAFYRDTSTSPDEFWICMFDSSVGMVKVQLT